MSINVNIIEEVPSTVLNGVFDLNAALSSIITQFSQGTVGGVLTDTSTGQRVGTWVADGPAVPGLDPDAAVIAQTVVGAVGAPVAGAVVAGTPAVGVPVAGMPANGVPVAAAPVAGAPVAGTPVAPVAGAVPAQSVALPCNVKVFGQDAQAPGTNRLLWSTSFSAQVTDGTAVVPNGLI